jgi:dipeptidyl aminopeptidase/acylaminoacyl peptidase
MFNQMLFVVRLFEMHPLGKLLGVVVLCCALGNSTRAQRLITPEDLYKLAAVRDPRLSPAGDRVAYVVSHSDATQNKQESEIWLVAADGSGEPRQLTDAGQSSQSPRWSPDGQWLAFVSARRRSGAAEGSSVVAAKPQVYGLSLAGGEAQRWTNLPNGVSSFNWSPDGKRIAFFSDRTNTYWEDLGDSLAGVWIVAAAGGKPIRIGDHASWLGSGGPVWSPDGTEVAYFGAVHSYDPRQIMLAPASGKEAPRTLASDLDLSVADLQWAEHGRALYFLSNVQGEQHVFRVDAESGNLEKVTAGARWVRGADINDMLRRMAFVASDFEHPPELYVAGLDGTSEKTISHVNDRFLKTLKLQPLERMSFKVADGLDVEGFLVRPAGWESHHKYPMILYIHGGPQGMFGTTWMLPAQVFAAHGWSVLLTNPRGSTGYGSKFMRASEKEWGGKIYSDLMSAVDAVVAKNGWIDADQLGVTGCSFGGFMTNWIISHTTRFQAAVPLCSISDFISDEGTRDDYYGHAHEFGGDLYQNFDLYWKYSPIRYASNVRTPTLIIHGEADQRVPVEQAEQWFRALRHFHVPSELVIFPHEFHNGLSNGEPRHVVEVMNWQIYWFERYLNHDSHASPPHALSPSGPASRPPATDLVK